MPKSSPDSPLPHDPNSHNAHRHGKPSPQPKRETTNPPDVALPARGDRLLRLAWLLLGTAFLALFVFTLVTVVSKGHRSQENESAASARAENDKTPSTNRDAPFAEADATDEHLVPTEEVDRVLGSGFTSPPPPPPPHVRPAAPPLESSPSLPPPPPRIKPTTSQPKPEPDKPVPPPPVADKTPTTTNQPTSADLDAAFEKRVQAADEDGRESLLAVPELRLFSDLEVQAFRDQEKTAQTGVRSRVGGNPVEYAFNVQLNQSMLKKARQEGLPLQLGPSSRLDFATATLVQTLSKNLRDLGFVSVPGTPARVVLSRGRPTVTNASPTDKIDAFKEWCDENKVEKFRGALATLLQMLQVEDVPTRLVLVRELAKVKSIGASAALAKRALVDLSPEVRAAAVAALEKRPRGQYVPVLLQGLRYPWPPVADRAALALRKLKPQGAVPKLVDLLDRPNPSVPVLEGKTKKPAVRELVRLNHMRNCFLCHAPSANDKDGLVRGLAPTPGQPLPRLYYAGQTGNFVRADITFLRQDFSVNLPVKAAAPWPDEQRFDFVTRVRTLEPNEMPEIAAQTSNYPQREAVQYALRGITGKDGGDSSATWRDLLGITKDKNADVEKTTANKGG
jgi:hypothetical protein